MSKPRVDPTFGISSADVLILTERHPAYRWREQMFSAVPAKRTSLKVSRKQTSHLDDAGVLPGRRDLLGLFRHHRLALACIRSTVAVLESQVGDRTDEIPIRRYYHSSRRASAPGRVRLWGRKARSLNPLRGRAFVCIPGAQRWRAPHRATHRNVAGHSPALGSRGVLAKPEAKRRR
jgi:hypothetical protein